MSALLAKLTSRQGRKYLYLVALAVVPLFVFYGIVKPEAAPLFVGLIAALLSITSPATALKNLPPKEPVDNA